MDNLEGSLDLNPEEEKVLKNRKSVTPEDIENAGYENVYEAIVVASKWAREINLERKRKKETGKILEEFDLEEFSPPSEKDKEEKENEKKVTVEAMEDLIDRNIDIARDEL